VYDVAQWDRLRLLVLAEEPLCRLCLQRGESTLSAEVDHILAIRFGGPPFDRLNLQALCKTCHSQKTRREMDSVDRQGGRGG